MTIRQISVILLTALFTLGCNRNSPSDTSPTETEKQRWIAQGWSFLETFGNASPKGLYLSHMSSPNARTVEAFASSAGIQTSKVYTQTNALFLVITMAEPSGDTFALVFTKSK